MNAAIKTIFARSCSMPLLNNYANVNILQSKCLTGKTWKISQNILSKSEKSDKKQGMWTRNVYIVYFVNQEYVHYFNWDKMINRHDTHLNTLFVVTIHDNKKKIVYFALYTFPLSHSGRGAWYKIIIYQFKIILFDYPKLYKNYCKF